MCGSPKIVQSDPEADAAAAAAKATAAANAKKAQRNRSNMGSVLASAESTNKTTLGGG